jgi:hypothetical protein
MNAKAKAQKKHFRRRVENRLGLEITDRVINRVIDDINNHRYISVLKQSARVWEYTMDFMGETCRILYDKTRKMPITILTEDMERREIRKII